jgi:hypothetical protein
VLAFWGNVIGLIAAAGKTLYDFVYSGPKFKRDSASDNTDIVLQAAESKRARNDWSTVVTFLVLAVGFAFSILALVRF